MFFLKIWHFRKLRKISWLNIFFQLLQLPTIYTTLNLFSWLDDKVLFTFEVRIKRVSKCKRGISSSSLVEIQFILAVLRDRAAYCHLLLPDIRRFLQNPCNSLSYYFIKVEKPNVVYVRRLKFNSKTNSNFSLYFLPQKSTK